MKPMLRLRILPLVLVTLALPLASCGGDDDSSKPQASRGTTGATGPTATSSNGSSQPKGTTGGSGQKSGSNPSGGANVPGSTSAPDRGSSSNGTERTASDGGSNQDGEKKSKSDSKRDGKSKKKGSDSGPNISNFTPLQYELYKQSRIVCKAQTLDAMAAQYKVARTPSAVAAAYANAYVETFNTPHLREAVAAGCKKGLT